METTLRRTTPKYATRTLTDARDDSAPFAWHAPTVVSLAVRVKGKGIADAVTEKIRSTIEGVAAKKG